MNADVHLMESGHGLLSLAVVLGKLVGFDGRGGVGCGGSGCFVVHGISFFCSASSTAAVVGWFYGGFTAEARRIRRDSGWVGEGGGVDCGYINYLP